MPLACTYVVDSGASWSQLLSALPDLVARLHLHLLSIERRRVGVCIYYEAIVVLHETNKHKQRLLLVEALAGRLHDHGPGEPKMLLLLGFQLGLISTIGEL